MSQANIDQFYAQLNSDPALLNSLTNGASTQAELVERAVAAGQAQGLPFTAADADAWIARQNAASESGELSDVQLEGVAGGKGAGSVLLPFLGGAPRGGIITDIATTVGNAFGIKIGN